MTPQRRDEIAWLLDVSDNSNKVQANCSQVISEVAGSVNGVKHRIAGIHEELQKRLGDKSPNAEELFEYAVALADARKNR
jgi:hypothetical protein